METTLEQLRHRHPAGDGVRVDDDVGYDAVLRVGHEGSRQDGADHPLLAMGAGELVADFWYSDRVESHAEHLGAVLVLPVSYTHLTLPTIYSV